MRGDLVDALSLLQRGLNATRSRRSNACNYRRTLLPLTGSREPCRGSLERRRSLDLYRQCGETLMGQEVSDSLMKEGAVAVNVSNGWTSGDADIIPVAGGGMAVREGGSGGTMEGGEVEGAGDVLSAEGVEERYVAGRADVEDGNNGRCGERRSRTFTLTLFTIVVVLLFSDQNLMAPNLSAIAEDFGLSDEEKDRKLGGDIAIAFFGFGAPASLLIGWLTDVVDRRKLFVAIVLIGEIGALATVWVTTYSQLYWTRALTGVAIGGGIPLVFSILGDLVGTTGRTEASGMIGIAIGVGQGMGQAVAGFTGHSTSLGWRFPFVLVSVPCVVLSAVVYVATRDPPRGRSEQGLQNHFEAGGEYTERMSLKGLRLLVNCPTVIMVLVQGMPGCIPWGVIGVYLNDFLHKQRGLTIEQATTVVVLFGMACSVGQLVGAKIGQFAYNRHPTLQPLLMGATTIAGVAPCVMLIRYNGDIFAPYVLFALMGGLLAAITGPNIRSVLMNVTLPSTRGTAFGVFSLFDDVGKGLGPALVSTMVARRGREGAFTIAILAWLACGAILLSIALTVKRDEAKVQTYLLDYAKAHVTTPGSQSSLPLPMYAPTHGSQYSAVLDGTELRSTMRAVVHPEDEEREGFATESEDEGSQMGIAADAEGEETLPGVRARRVEQR